MVQGCGEQPCPHCSGAVLGFPWLLAAPVILPVLGAVDRLPRWVHAAVGRWEQWERLHSTFPDLLVQLSAGEAALKLQSLSITQSQERWRKKGLLAPGN